MTDHDAVPAGPPDDTTPAEAEDWAEQNWPRFAEVGSFDFACEAYEAGAARATAAQLQRDIQLATEYNARYVVYECPQSTRVGRVPVEYPFADLLAEDTP